MKGSTLQCNPNFRCRIDAGLPDERALPRAGQLLPLWLKVSLQYYRTVQRSENTSIGVVPNPDPTLEKEKIRISTIMDSESLGSIRMSHSSNRISGYVAWGNPWNYCPTGISKLPDPLGPKKIDSGWPPRNWIPSDLPRNQFRDRLWTFQMRGKERFIIVEKGSVSQKYYKYIYSLIQIRICIIFRICSNLKNLDLQHL